MVDLRIGKTIVHVRVKGCVDCGTEHSSGWHDAGYLMVVFKRNRKMLKHEAVTLHRCADCQGVVHA